MTKSALSKEAAYREVLHFVLGRLRCDYVVLIESCDADGRKGNARCRSCLIRDEINKVLEAINAAPNPSS